jgi:hypothetical protein
MCILCPLLWFPRKWFSYDSMCRNPYLWISCKLTQITDITEIVNAWHWSYDTAIFSILMIIQNTWTWSLFYSVYIQHVSTLGVRTAHSVEGQATGCTARVQFLAGAKDFSLLHSGQTGSEAHPPSYTMDIAGSFPEGKAVSFWRWPVISIWCWGQAWWSYTSMPPYGLIKHKGNFTFYVPTSKIKLCISEHLRLNKNIKKYLYWYDVTDSSQVSIRFYFWVFSFYSTDGTSGRHKMVSQILQINPMHWFS